MYAILPIALCNNIVSASAVFTVSSEPAGDKSANSQIALGAGLGAGLGLACVVVIVLAVIIVRLRKMISRRHDGACITPAVICVTLLSVF